MLHLLLSYLSDHPPGQSSFLFRCHCIQSAFVQSGLEAGILIGSLGGIHLMEGKVWSALCISLVHVSHYGLADVYVSQVFVANVIQLLTQLRVTTADDQNLQGGMQRHGEL